MQMPLEFPILCDRLKSAHLGFPGTPAKEVACDPECRISELKQDLWLVADREELGWHD